MPFLRWVQLAHLRVARSLRLAGTGRLGALGALPQREREGIIRGYIATANDGVVSNVGIIAGLAVADVSNRAILASAVIALVVGASSAAGTQYTLATIDRDALLADIADQKERLAQSPEEEVDDLERIYREKGLTAETARQVALELTAHDALGAHIEDELGVDDSDFFSPWRIALATWITFALGALAPVLMVTFIHTDAGTAVSFIAVAASLTITSIIGARLGGSRAWLTVLRTVGIGVATLLLASLVGSFLD